MFKSLDLTGAFTGLVLTVMLIAIRLCATSI